MTPLFDSIEKRGSSALKGEKMNRCCFSDMPTIYSGVLDILASCAIHGLDDGTVHSRTLPLIQ